MELFCKKCGNPLSGRQESYCSKKCSRRHLKSLWQKRRRGGVNQAKTAWRKSTNRQSDKDWEKRNSIKVRAHKLVHYALRLEFLVRKPCEECGNPISQAHHSDYTKPLEVKWLCAQHHVNIHNHEKYTKRVAL